MDPYLFSSFITGGHSKQCLADGTKGLDKFKVVSLYLSISISHYFILFFKQYTHRPFRKLQE